MVSEQKKSYIRSTLTKITFPGVIDIDDSAITISIDGGEKQTYWAKEISRDSTGVPTYKLLPMDRA